MAAIGPEDNALIEGLLDFYASQADVLLAQFRNINQLLGQTSDQTWPGTLCEVLVRDFIRRNVPSYMQVDKGFVYGHTERGGDLRHCPEVDILIHNPSILAPVFRLDDFVIVRAETTLGLIQVKRTLTKQTCGKGITNVAQAKSHVVKMLLGEKPVVTMNDVRPLFSAVIGMTDEFGGKDRDPEKVREDFSEMLTKASVEYPPCPVRRRDPTGVSMLPQFVGSFKDYFALLRLNVCAETQVYHVFKSFHEGKNIAIQALLYGLAHNMFPPGSAKPVFDFPLTLQAFAVFTVEQKVTVADAEATPTECE